MTAHYTQKLRHRVINCLVLDHIVSAYCGQGVNEWLFDSRSFKDGTLNFAKTMSLKVTL